MARAKAPKIAPEHVRKGSKAIIAHGPQAKSLFDRNENPKFGYGNDRTLVDHAYNEVQHSFEVDRTKADIPLYNEVVAGLSVPSSSFYAYEKSKKGDFNIKQQQRQLINAEKFTLSDNFVKMAVALSFSYPRYIAQLMPKAIPCFDNLWIEWNELTRWEALQEEFAKLGLAADTKEDRLAKWLK